MYLVSALLTFGTLCLRIPVLFLLLLSTISKGVLTSILHISVTVLNRPTDFYVRRSVYRSTGLHGSKEEEEDHGDDEIQ